MATSVKIFVASASEGLQVAHALGKVLEDHEGFRPCVWDEGTFKPSLTFIEALEVQLDQSDFAILTLTPDDRVVSRGKSRRAPRDNVLFELGLFMGRLGRERTYFMFDKACDPKIPSDLLGVSPAPFKRVGGVPLEDCLRDASTRVVAQIRELGAREKLDPVQSAHIHRVKRFCRSIQGLWLQIASRNDKFLRIFRVLEEYGGHSVRLEGYLIAENGICRAHWKSKAVGINTDTKSLSYSWKGERCEEAYKSFHGFGWFDFTDASEIYSYGHGKFADNPVGTKVVKWRTVELRRVEMDADRIYHTVQHGTEAEKASLVRDLSRSYRSKLSTSALASGSRSGRKRELSGMRLK